MTKNLSVEEIKDKDDVLAIILRASYNSEGIKFLTPNSYSQQLGYMKRPTGYTIEPHLHNYVSREVKYTNEVLFIKNGKLRVDFYDIDKVYLESRMLHSGDVVLLIKGGHGFEMLETSEIIEVKQGPYLGEHDKVRFEPVAKHAVRFNRTT